MAASSSSHLTILTSPTRSTEVELTPVLRELEIIILELEKFTDVTKKILKEQQNNAQENFEHESKENQENILDAFVREHGKAIVNLKNKLNGLVTNNKINSPLILRLIQACYALEDSMNADWMDPEKLISDEHIERVKEISFVNVCLLMIENHLAIENPSDVELIFKIIKKRFDSPFTYAAFNKNIDFDELEELERYGSILQKIVTACKQKSDLQTDVRKIVFNHYDALLRFIGNGLELLKPSEWSEKSLLVQLRDEDEEEEDIAYDLVGTGPALFTYAVYQLITMVCPDKKKDLSVYLLKKWWALINGDINCFYPLISREENFAKHMINILDVVVQAFHIEHVTESAIDAESKGDEADSLSKAQATKLLYIILNDIKSAETGLYDTSVIKFFITHRALSLAQLAVNFGMEQDHEKRNDIYFFAIKRADLNLLLFLINNDYIPVTIDRHPFVLFMNAVKKQGVDRDFGKEEFVYTAMIKKLPSSLTSLCEGVNAREYLARTLFPNPFFQLSAEEIYLEYLLKQHLLTRIIQGQYPSGSIIETFADNETEHKQSDLFTFVTGKIHILISLLPEGSSLIESAKCYLSQTIQKNESMSYLVESNSVESKSAPSFLESNPVRFPGITSLDDEKAEEKNPVQYSYTVIDEMDLLQMANKVTNFFNNKINRPLLEGYLLQLKVVPHSPPTATSSPSSLSHLQLYSIVGATGGKRRRVDASAEEPSAAPSDQATPPGAGLG